MSITITKFAEEKISSIMLKTNTSESYLKIRLVSGGCSGLSYKFEYTDEPDEGDKVFQFKKLKICIDKKSYIFLNGTEIDYEEGLLKSGIILNNPNANRSCGCGESFSF